MSAHEDAEILQKAFKGVGTDEAAVIKVLTHRNPHQVEELKQAFHALTGKDLSKEIHSELSGHFLRVIDGILKGPVEFDADNLHRAIKGLGTDEHALIEVLAGRTNEETDAIAATYHALFGHTLAEDITNDTSGDFKNILLALLHHRSGGHSHPHDPAADAEALFKAGEGKLGTDEKVFIDIFTSRSYPHLKTVFNIYENHHKHHSIVQAIDGEFSGHVKIALRAIAVFVLNPGDYYAQLVYTATHGTGTNDDKLIRVIVGQRHHIEDIKTAFSTRYGRTLHNFVRDDTSGDYRHALLELIGNADVKMA